MQSSNKAVSDLATTRLLVSDILADLDTPYSRKLLQSLSMGDWRACVDTEMPRPSEYLDSPDRFARDYLAYNLLRKSEFLDLGVDRAQAATNAFHESEESCARINQFGYNPYVIDRGIRTTSYEAQIHCARKLIKKVLGKFCWNAAQAHFGFSSGASTRLPRKSGSPFYKFQGKPEVTPAAKVALICEIWQTPLWRACYADNWLDPDSWVSMVAGSRADTVPKTWKTDRFICIEPEGNMLLQRGIGGLIRKRLKRVGIDLDDQTLNQRLACIGSRTGSLATIDLKAASDSIALELVRELLPADWFDAIFLARSHYTMLNGVWTKLEKVSSMGNGFTFELESLIFWALSQSVLETYEIGDRRLAVYGDDIVIHNSAAEPLIGLLSYVGFETNKDKTFVSGPFRESCGKHYFLGVDVSPFNIKSKIESEDRFYWLYNSYNEWLSRFPSFTGVLNKMKRRGRKFASRFCIVPVGYGYDSGIETPLSETKVIWSSRRGGYLMRCLRAVRKKHRPNGTPALLWWLSSNRSAVLSEDILELHKGETVYKRFTRFIPQWP